MVSDGLYSESLKAFKMTILQDGVLPKKSKLLVTGSFSVVNDTG